MRSKGLRGWRPVLGVIAVGAVAFGWSMSGATADDSPGLKNAKQRVDRTGQLSFTRSQGEAGEASSSASQGAVMQPKASIGLQGAVRSERKFDLAAGSPGQPGAVAGGGACICDVDCADGNPCTDNTCDWASDCCIANGGMGCDDMTCETAVCAIDSVCCDTEWDDICAGIAQDECAVCAGGGTCSSTNTDPGTDCNDLDGDGCTVGACDGAGTCDAGMGADPCAMEVGDCFDPTPGDDDNDWFCADECETDADCPATGDAFACVDDDDCLGVSPDLGCDTGTGFCRSDGCNSSGACIGGTCFPVTNCAADEFCSIDPVATGQCEAVDGRCCDGAGDPDCEVTSLAACSGAGQKWEFGGECGVCPKYSNGVAFVAGADPVPDRLITALGPIGQLGTGCEAYDTIGDDYTLANGEHLQLEEITFRGAPVYADPMDDASTPAIRFRFLVEDPDNPGEYITAALTVALGFGPATNDGLFTYWTFPATVFDGLVIPPSGIMVMENIGAQGSGMFWTATNNPSAGMADTGMTDESLLWVNGQLRSFLSDPGVALKNSDDSMIFQLGGNKVGDQLGACCDPAGIEPCEQLQEYLCDAAGKNFIGVGVSCTPDPCVDGACCRDADGACEIVDNPTVNCAAPDTFLGFGTDCDPDCCPGLSTGGADLCSAAATPSLSVPGSLTKTGDTTGASDGSDCNTLAPDETYWEGFTLTGDASLVIDHCCTDPIPSSSYIVMSTDACVGGQCDFVFADTSGRGAPYCDDNNLWNEFDAVEAGTYYYPVFDDPMDPDANDYAYSVHVTAEELPPAVCCLPPAMPGDPAICTDVSTVGGPCDGGCNVLTCDAAGGTFIPDNQFCIGDPCALGACCTGPGMCEDAAGVGISNDDCDTLMGDWVAGARCDDSPFPCAVCLLDPGTDCKPDDGAFVLPVDLDPDAGDDVVGVKRASDFTPAGASITSVCTQVAYINPTTGNTNCNPPDAPSVTDDMLVRVSENNMGFLGAEVGSRNPALVRGPEQIPGLISYDASMDFSGNPITVMPGECYWMEIMNNTIDPPGNGCNMYIADSKGGPPSTDDPDIPVGYGLARLNDGMPYDENDISNFDTYFCVDSGLITDGDGLTDCATPIGACCVCGAPCEDGVEPAECNLELGGTFFLGEMCMDITCPGGPTNDECVGAEAAVHPGGDDSMPAEVAFDTSCATPLETYAVCGTVGSRDVWVSYEAACTAEVTASLCTDTNYDAMLTVFDGCGGSEITCDDDGCGGVGVPSEAVFEATGGETYLFRIGGWNAERGQGTISISIDCGSGIAPPLPERHFDGNPTPPGGAGDPALNHPCTTDADCENQGSGAGPNAHCLTGADSVQHCYVAKNRSITVEANPANDGVPHSLRVSWDSGGGVFVPVGFVDATPLGGTNIPAAHPLQATPDPIDWNASFPRVHITGCEISPGNTYRVQALPQGADPNTESNYSAPVELETSAIWGDVTGAPILTGAASGPDNFANLGDVLDAVLAAGGTPTAPSVWFDVEGGGTENIDNFTNLADALQLLGAVTNPYPFPAPGACP